MSNLPALRSGCVAMYPATITREYVTDIVQFVNDAEQRWAARQMNADFQLVFTGVNSYDVNIMREFFVSKKGRFLDSGLTNTFTIADAKIPGAPYNYCYFDQDDFTTAAAGAGNRYNFVLQIKQART
jgi:hypothetical protein